MFSASGYIIPSIAKIMLGGCIFIYSGSARLTSFEINFISKETSRAEPEYMNIHPPISVLATALLNVNILHLNFSPSGLM